ncbi:hypothetical protein L3Q65_33775 [Amycolatopsis sp. FU40]|nr:hypothetical protein [Amycolatopsis sp. FU40]UKD52844.1 hypothetical protein L3Q65_33775 [Amycolatopsis sp. FU40]
MQTLRRSFAVTAVAALALTGTGTAAFADDGPPPIVEYYDYPGADQIFAEHGIRLLKGDGHILFTDCAAPGSRVEIWSRTSTKSFCFRITADKGYLSLDLAKVYLIWGDNHAMTATMTTNGQTKQVKIEKNQWNSVGEPTDPDKNPSSLVELNSGPA